MTIAQLFGLFFLSSNWSAVVGCAGSCDLWSCAEDALSRYVPQWDSKTLSCWAKVWCMSVTY